MRLLREKQPWGTSITMVPFPDGHKLCTCKLIAEISGGTTKFLVSGVYVTTKLLASEIIALSAAMRQLVEAARKEKNPSKQPKPRKARRK